MRSTSPRFIRRWILTILVVIFSNIPWVARSEDIEGVQPAAMDQPRINLVVRRLLKDKPLGEKANEEDSANIEAFLDTGASGIVLSAHSADSLGVLREHITGRVGDVLFDDVGVGGSSKFAISEPLFLSIAASVGNNYDQTCGPMRTQIGPLDAQGGLLEALLLGHLDIVGTPAMVGKVVVMDTKDVNTFTDKIRTYVYDPKSKVFSGPGIPKTRRHIQLSFASFKPFTQLTPASAQGPAMFANPFIGPNPLAPAGDQTPPIIVAHKGKSSAGSWLLDTGAAASMISRKQAAALGITYAVGTFGTDHPKLDGVAADQQFTLTVGGIGGAKRAAGVYLDKLALRTREGQPLVYIHAPVLVADITVKDPVTGREMTLDGVFGMNFLVASAKLDEAALLPDIDKLTPGAFRWIVYDQSAGLLGLE
jgi:hypothetical protein